MSELPHPLIPDPPVRPSDATPVPDEPAPVEPSSEDETVEPDPRPAGPVGARTYTHRALADRVVVRLVHESGASAMDAEMALVGFDWRQSVDGIGAADLLPAAQTSWVGTTGIELPPGSEPQQTHEWLIGRALQHVVGGLAPWPGLVDDLRSVAKRAGLDPNAAVERFAADALGASSLHDAPSELWPELAPALVAVAQRDPVARGRLLDLFPVVWSESVKDQWLQILLDSGALSALWNGRAEPESMPREGRVAWFSRLCAWAGPNNGWVLQIARRATLLLASEGPPVVLARGDDGLMDLDLLDLLSEMSIPWVVAPGRTPRLDLRAWARGVGVPARGELPPERRPRDPIFGVRDPEVAAMLRPAVAAAMGDAVFEEAGRCSAIVELRNEWILRQIDRVGSTEASTAEAALVALESLQRLSAFAEEPRLVSAIAGTPVSPDPALERRWTAFRDRVPRPIAEPVPLDDARIAAALGGWPRRPGGPLGAALGSLASFLVHGDVDSDIATAGLDPSEWMGRVRGLAWLASRPGTTEEERRAATDLLLEWTRVGLAEPGLVRVGRLRIDAIQDWIPARAERQRLIPYAVWTAWIEDRRLVVLDCPETPNGPWHARFVERAPVGGAFADWPGVTIISARDYDTSGDVEWISAFCAALARLGPRTISPAQAQAVAVATGLGPTQAEWVLSGCPAASAHGLHLSTDTVLELLSAAVPLDPADLWTDDGAEGLAALWVDSIGKAAPVKPALAAEAEREAPDANRWLPLVASPATWAGLREDAAWEVTRRGEIRPVGAALSEVFDPGALPSFARLAGWLIGRLPVGDPLLVNLVKVYEQVRARLGNPRTVLPAGRWVVPAELASFADALFEAFGGALREVEDADGNVLVRQRRGGALVATFTGAELTVAVEPTRLEPSERALAAEVGERGGDPLLALRAWELLQSEDFSALLERAWRTPLGAGEWEQDPSRSAPHVVRIMARRFKLADAAAVLYLQTLTLLGATRDAVRRWNRWTEATYDQAVEELVRAELVARRSPDGPLWVAGVAPDEGPGDPWKRELYGWDGQRFPLGEPVLLAPVHVLFARAWERCIEG